MYNTNARLHDRISEAEYKKARMIGDPINLLDASPTGDGAAALLLVPLDSLKSNGIARIVIAGSTAATDSIAIHDRKDGLWLSAAYSSACKAYEQAGIQPEDIDIFELHDAFSIMAALSLEACGFAERGQAFYPVKTMRNPKAPMVRRASMPNWQTLMNFTWAASGWLA